MKAILITKTNQDMLASRYALEVWDIADQLPIGNYLIADFGNEDKIETLTKAQFEATFVVGEALKNGFVAIARI